jgi:hypothetical protein
MINGNNTAVRFQIDRPMIGKRITPLKKTKTKTKTKTKNAPSLFKPLHPKANS